MLRTLTNVNQSISVQTEFIFGLPVELRYESEMLFVLSYFKNAYTKLFSLADESEVHSEHKEIFLISSNVPQNVWSVLKKFKMS